MKNILKLEFKNCINRREFKIVLSIVMIISLGSFIASCVSFYGSDILHVRSACEMGIVEGEYSNNFLELLILILPILATLIYSDSYYEDRKNGSYISITTRVGVERYIWAKVIVIFTVTFLIFFVPLILNQMLSFIAFPLEGLDNNQGLPFYDIGVQNYMVEFLFSFMKLQHPLLHNIFKIFLISLFAGLWGILSYAVHFIVYMHKKEKYPVLIFVFAIYVLCDLILRFLNIHEYSYRNFLLPNGTGSEAVVFIWIFGLLVVDMTLVYVLGNEKKVKNIID